MNATEEFTDPCDCPELEHDLAVYGEHFHFDGHRIDPVKIIALRALSDQPGPVHHAHSGRLPCNPTNNSGCEWPTWPVGDDGKCDWCREFDAKEDR